MGSGFCHLNTKKLGWSIIYSHFLVTRRLQLGQMMQDSSLQLVLDGFNAYNWSLFLLFFFYDDTIPRGNMGFSAVGHTNLCSDARLLKMGFQRNGKRLRDKMLCFLETRSAIQLSKRRLGFDSSIRTPVKGVYIICIGLYAYLPKTYNSEVGWLPEAPRFHALGV